MHMAACVNKKANYTHVKKHGYRALHNAALAGDVETMNILAEARLNGLNIHAKGRTVSDSLEQCLMKSEDLQIAFSILLCCRSRTLRTGDY